MMIRLMPLLAAVLLTACSSVAQNPSRALYDFGPLAAAKPVPLRMPSLVVAEASGAAQFEGNGIVYRLQYADPRQTHVYAHSQWSDSALQLVSARIRARLAETGAGVLGMSDARTGAPLLKMELLDFSHSFSSPGASQGQISLRASLFQGQKLLAQKQFTRQQAAASADARGGVAALVQATDALGADLVEWLAQHH